tara:strand:- start:671 stop:820 length:150 start_codon:yes stop_codon:yes gene_type:complete
MMVCFIFRMEEREKEMRKKTMFLCIRSLARRLSSSFFVFFFFFVVVFLS